MIKADPAILDDYQASVAALVTFTKAVSDDVSLKAAAYATGCPTSVTGDPSGPLVSATNDLLRVANRAKAYGSLLRALDTDHDGDVDGAEADNRSLIDGFLALATEDPSRSPDDVLDEASANTAEARARARALADDLAAAIDAGDLDALHEVLAGMDPEDANNPYFASLVLNRTGADRLISAADELSAAANGMDNQGPAVEDFQVLADLFATATRSLPSDARGDDLSVSDRPPDVLDYRIVDALLESDDGRDLVLGMLDVTGVRVHSGVLEDVAARTAFSDSPEAWGPGWMRAGRYDALTTGTGDRYRGLLRLLGEDERATRRLIDGDPARIDRLVELGVDPAPSDYYPPRLGNADVVGVILQQYFATDAALGSGDAANRVRDNIPVLMAAVREHGDVPPELADSLAIVSIAQIDFITSLAEASEQGNGVVDPDDFNDFFARIVVHDRALNLLVTGAELVRSQRLQEQLDQDVETAQLDSWNKNYRIFLDAVHSAGQGTITPESWGAAFLVAGLVVAGVFAAIPSGGTSLAVAAALASTATGAALTYAEEQAEAEDPDDFAIPDDGKSGLIKPQILRQISREPDWADLLVYPDDGPIGDATDLRHRISEALEPGPERLAAVADLLTFAGAQTDVRIKALLDIK